MGRELVKRSAVVRMARERIGRSAGITRLSPATVDALCDAGERAIEDLLVSMVEGHEMASGKRKRRTLGAYKHGAGTQQKLV